MPSQGAQSCSPGTRRKAGFGSSIGTQVHETLDCGASFPNVRSGEWEKILSLHLPWFALLVTVQQIITATKLIQEIILRSDFSCGHVPDSTQLTEFHLFIAFAALFVYCDIVAD